MRTILRFSFAFQYRNNTIFCVWFFQMYYTRWNWNRYPFDTIRNTYWRAACSAQRVQLTNHPFRSGLRIFNTKHGRFHDAIALLLWLTRRVWHVIESADLWNWFPWIIAERIIEQDAGRQRITTYAPMNISRFWRWWILNEPSPIYRHNLSSHTNATLTHHLCMDHQPFPILPFRKSYMVCRVSGVVNRSRLIYNTIVPFPKNEFHRDRET